MTSSVYWLDELERDFGSDELGEAAINRGVGAFLNHARNRLARDSGQQRPQGVNGVGTGQGIWSGASKAAESIEDHLSEWSLVDSAGFITPTPKQHRLHR